MTEMDAEGEGTEGVLLAAALGVTIVGLLVLIVGDLASGTPAFLVAGFGVMAIGLVLAFAAGVVEGRRSGRGFFRSLWDGFLTLLSWIWALVSV